MNITQDSIPRRKVQQQIKSKAYYQDKKSISGRLPITPIDISETGLLLNRICASVKIYIEQRKLSLFFSIDQLL